MCLKLFYHSISIMIFLFKSIRYNFITQFFIYANLFRPITYKILYFNISPRKRINIVCGIWLSDQILFCLIFVLCLSYFKNSRRLDISMPPDFCLICLAFFNKTLSTYISIISLSIFSLSTLSKIVRQVRQIATYRVFTGL